MAIDSVSGFFQTGNIMHQAEASAAKGSFKGNSVSSVPTPESLLADAAEELSFSADTTDEFELRDRRERDKISKSLADRVRLYQELMHQAGKSEQMDQLRDSLKTRSDGRHALDKAREFFPDPSDAWAALKELEEEFRSSGADKAVLEDIESALAQMEEKEGASIRAGIQGALSSAGFEDVGSVDEMRDLYRQTVCEFQAVKEVFSHVLEKYGADGFDRAMDFLFSALGADLASDQPSMGEAHLESVQSSLGQVRLTQSAFRLCEQMVVRWEKVHGVSQQNFTAMALLGDVVSLSEKRFLGASDVESIMAKAGPPDIEHEVLFLQELLSTVRKFPVGLFDGDQGRMKVMDVVQEAVDLAVTREDEYLAQLEGE